MKHFIFCITLPFVVFVAESFAAEIKFKDEPVRCTKTLVLLGDVAEIVAQQEVNVDQLRQTILCKAPMIGEQRTFSAVELRTLLSQVGVDSTKHSLSGKGSLTLIGAESSATPGTASCKDAVSSQLIKTLENQLSEALAVHLNRTVTKNMDAQRELPWSIALKLNRDQAYALATGGRIDDIEGGEAPFTGIQGFRIVMKNVDVNTGHKIVVAVDADVSVEQRIVVVKRTLPKGYIIGESDVELRKVEKFRGDDFLIDLSDAIGMETTAVVREFSVLESAKIKHPTLVRRGDIVTVRSMMNGIIVRLNGKALDDGVKGSTILIESLVENDTKNRTRRNAKEPAPTFSARVTEPGTVEVYASTTKI